MFTLLLLIPPVLAQYSYTLHNTLDEGDGRGAVHTWLSLSGPGTCTYFNFVATTRQSARGVRPDLGRRTRPEKLSTRKGTAEFTEEISEAQYTSIQNEILRFYSCFRYYSRYPNGTYNTYNDVTACHRVLHAGLVDILENIEQSDQVEEKILELKRREKTAVLEVQGSA